MVSVKGIFQKGVARPLAPVKGHDGQAVMITFLRGKRPPKSGHSQDHAWEQFERLVSRCEVETGIRDLAEHHDHYLYGKPKKK